MKKKNIIILGLILLSFTLSSSLVLSNNNIDRGYISVSATSSKEISPDTVEISFMVKTTNDKLLQSAVSENKVLTTRVIASLEKIIDKNSGDSIKTVDYNAMPVYEYKDSKKIFSRYEVTNKVVVKSKKLDLVGTMIDNSIKNGATNVDNLRFYLEDYSKYCDELIVKASKTAQKRANLISEAISTPLDGIRTFNTTCSPNNYNSPRLYMAKNIALSADSISEDLATPISAGLVKLNANVDMTIFTK